MCVNSTPLEIMSSNALNDCEGDGNNASLKSVKVYISCHIPSNNISEIITFFMESIFFILYQLSFFQKSFFTKSAYDGGFSDNPYSFIFSVRRA